MEVANIEITQVKTDQDLVLIEKLADTIWRDHYIPIIGLEQVNYMLNKFQSFRSMKDQINEGYLYFRIVYDKKSVGYMSFKEKEGSLFLSKIYLLKKYRNKKIGKNAMVFVEGKTLELGLKSIVLTVNKNNSNSIMSYEKMGFYKVESIVMDIGNGFIMDDYKMEKTL